MLPLLDAMQRKRLARRRSRKRGTERVPAWVGVMVVSLIPSVGLKP